MLQQIANGLALGGIYALTAVAYSMVYGIVGLINFAFGAMFMVGAFAAAFVLGSGIPIFNTVYTGPDLGLGLAVLVGMVAAGFVGWVVERVAYRPLRDAPTIAPLITSLGALIFLQATAALVFGGRGLPFPSDNVLGGSPIEIGGVILTRPQLTVFIASLLLAWGLDQVLRRTTFGLKTQASAQDINTAELQGINSNRVIAYTFIIGSMMAGIAGVFWGSLFNFLSPTMGFRAGLVGLVAAVLGGIGSIRGSLLGGLVLGVVQSLSVAFVPGASGFGDGFAFAILILLLWRKPEGLLGSPATSRPGSIERPLPVFTRMPRSARAGRRAR